MSDLTIVELLVATGAALILVGVGLIHWPAALITAGLMLLSLVALALLLDEGHDEADDER